MKACEVKDIAQTLGRELGYELAASGEDVKAPAARPPHKIK